jgi:hypothetical protein
MNRHIPLKWGEEEYKYFNKKIPVVERELFNKTHQ